MRVPAGTLLWEACKAHGIDIPIFCYHTKLGPVGACRTCLVEIQGMRGPATACSTPVTDGMVVRTRSPLTEKAQRGIFEFLLLNHPLDCPICDRAGECPLQDQTFAYGPGTSRYIEPKRHHVKPIPLGPTIALDRERCVLCWRCVRFCSEIAEDKSIILLDRGDHSLVGTFQNEPYVSNFSGNVVELCPVGALTSRKQRFNFRPWELQNRASICPHCAFGCNINISVRKNDEVIRFLSRDNPEVDDSWLCDRGRFNYEFINTPERLKAPLIRQGDQYQQVSWPQAFQFIADRLAPILEESGPGAIAGIASPRLSNEDLWIFKRFMRDTLATPHFDHFPRPRTALTGAGQAAMERLDRSLTTIASLEEAKTIVLLGANPSEREPVMELRIRKAINRHGARLVVISDEDIPLSSKANARLTYQPGGLAGMTRSLTHGLHGAAEGAIEALISEYLQEGPIVLIYDDSFPRVPDKDGALQAVAALAAALADRVSLGVLPLLDDSNSMGARQLGVVARDAQTGAWAEPVVDRLVEGGFRAAFILGANLVRDVPSLELQARLASLDLVVVHELMLTETTRYADVILPAASFAEKVGTFTNTEGRLQRLTEAVPSPGMARADWQILVDLSQYLPQPLDFALPRDIWSDMGRSVPAFAGLEYEDIGSQGRLIRALQPV